jgi:hypothetical protein
VEAARSGGAAASGGDDGAPVDGAWLRSVLRLEEGERGKRGRQIEEESGGSPEEGGGGSVWLRGRCGARELHAG